MFSKVRKFAADKVTSTQRLAKPDANDLAVQVHQQVQLARMVKPARTAPLLTPRDTLQLQRLAGNRATGSTKELITATTPTAEGDKVSSEASTRHDVLRLQRTIGNRAVGALLRGIRQSQGGPHGTIQRGIVQLQRAPTGGYRVIKSANLRNNDQRYSIVRKLPTGELVEVTDKGPRQSNFKAGAVTNEHSWVKTKANEVGWVVDGKLQFEPAVAPQQQPPQPQQQPPQPQQQPPQPQPAIARSVERLYAIRQIREDDLQSSQTKDFNYFVTKLYEYGQNNLAMMNQAPLSADAVDSAIAAILKRMGAGGGDYALAVKDTLPEVVRAANELGYPINVKEVQSLLQTIATHLGGLGHTTVIGEKTESKWGGFYEYK